MSYQSLPEITGCCASSELLRDITSRGTLQGGRDHCGQHWIYLSAAEAARVLKVCRNKAAKLLDRLVQLGFVIREKLGKEHFDSRVQHTWFYRPGPNCPQWLLNQKGQRFAPEGTEHCPPEGQSKQKPTSIPNDKEKKADSEKRQPAGEKRVVPRPTRPGKASCDQAQEIIAQVRREKEQHDAIPLEELKKWQAAGRKHLPAETRKTQDWRTCQHRRYASTSET